MAQAALVGRDVSKLTPVAASNCPGVCTSIRHCRPRESGDQRRTTRDPRFRGDDERRRLVACDNRAPALPGIDRASESPWPIR